MSALDRQWGEGNLLAKSPPVGFVSVFLSFFYFFFLFFKKKHNKKNLTAKKTNKKNKQQQLNHAS